MISRHLGQCFIWSVDHDIIVHHVHCTFRNTIYRNDSIRRPGVIRIIGNSQVGGGRLIEAMLFGPSKKCQKVKKTIGFVNLTDVLCPFLIRVIILGRVSIPT